MPSFQNFRSTHWTYINTHLSFICETTIVQRTLLSMISIAKRPLAYSASSIRFWRLGFTTCHQQYYDLQSWLQLHLMLASALHFATWLHLVASHMPGLLRQGLARTRSPVWFHSKGCNYMCDCSAQKIAGCQGQQRNHNQMHVDLRGSKQGMKGRRLLIPVPCVHLGFLCSVSR